MFANSFGPDNHSLLSSYYSLGLTHSPFQTHYGPCSFATLKNDSRSTRTLPETAEGKGKWTAQQQGLYINFLIDNMDQMRCRTKRKSLKVFLQMARKVKSRTADQCRSHHQKILKYHRQSLEQIITHYQDLPAVALFKAQAAKKSSQTFKPTGFEDDHPDAGVVSRSQNRFRIEINTDVIPLF